MTRRLVRAAAACAGVGVSTASFAADHREAPAVSLRPAADINDVYVFVSPQNPDNTVMIMTVNPSAETNGFRLDTNVLYEFNIDNNGDTIPEVSYTFGFSPVVGGEQSVGGTRSVNGGIPTLYGSGLTGTDIATPDGGKLRVDVFDDPFFFDLAGFQDDFNFTGDDAFAGTDVTALVLEIPTEEIQDIADQLSVWTRTFDVSSTPSFGQVDRMGFPAINTALIPSARKDEFNRVEPFNDVSAFGADVRDVLLAINGGDLDAALDLIDVLLPDVLPFDPAGPAGFPNGRRLGDDAMDRILELVSNGGVTTDGVNANDRAFSDTFPYLAPPNVLPEPAVVGLVVAGVVVMRRRRR